MTLGVEMSGYGGTCQNEGPFQLGLEEQAPWKSLPIIAAVSWKMLTAFGDVLGMLVPVHHSHSTI